VETLQEQISQSESNLAAQKEVTQNQVQAATVEAIHKAKLSHLEMLANTTGMDLEEMDTGQFFVLSSQGYSDLPECVTSGRLKTGNFKKQFQTFCLQQLRTQRCVNTGLIIFSGIHYLCS
jgi:hypothetical protein